MTSFNNGRLTRRKSCRETGLVMNEINLPRSWKLWLKLIKEMRLDSGTGILLINRLFLWKICWKKKATWVHEDFCTPVCALSRCVCYDPKTESSQLWVKSVGCSGNLPGVVYNIVGMSEIAARFESTVSIDETTIRIVLCPQKMLILSQNIGSAA